MKRVLVATTNAGKLAELAPMLRELGWEAVGLADVPGVAVAPEDAEDFPGNARDKALHYAAATGLPALADDSGLEVEALGGAPGVHSARYAGPEADDEDNRRKLLEALQGVADRRARFACALCLVEDGAPSIEVVGYCAGRIADAPRGEAGFGYDPLFVPEDASAGGRTFAEMEPAEKRRISHRARALAALRHALQEHDDAAGARPGTAR